ncbi:MAG: transporter substrate-binding domain-containing protein [Levilactobacillus sp.]|jgi:cystine transport system substrate-binding protein|uniref:transporter substrate-binding domain-containing protein n=1 Tax=Levilactobacillus sp. TaxID=2767919 RepID=UPI00258F388D|nr:transporter substrate-binding domain-containing protein [Levilactobacillus sp.]MCH4123144.1 transporter substrate-binding domain-containing protein [Levilactobacillus sp.]MCI1552718.1 transporter substrate-binding domain-containing protein [Levilactobacillus sp.]MCI1598968.1 transporter substrate-binding domain-containing protein [Levilactobacillus sp.]MCI1606452.1 transporter substrate-binding domain-containing protein [Levilactobacillus sp.]
MNKTKKWLVLGLGLSLVMGVGLVGCGKSSSESTNTKVANKKTLIVATSGTLYPTSFHASKNSKLTGFDVEVVRAVAKGLHKKVEFKELSVDGQLTAVNSGKADMAANDFGLSPARKDKYALSTVYKHSFNSIMVRNSDDSGIHNWADIEGKKSAGEAGTGYQRLAQQLGAKLVNYDNVSNDVYLKDVKNGKTDFIMNDYYLQKLALKAIPNNGLHLVKNMYFTTSDDGQGVGILMKKSNTKLKAEINKEIKKLLKDGTIKKLSEKYYGADVTKKPNVKIAKNFTIKSKYTGQ